MKIFNGNISQLNIGKRQGKLYESFGCDLTESFGQMSIAPRTKLTTDNVTNMTTPVGFKYFDDRWFTAAGRVFFNTVPTAEMIEDSSSGVPTDCGEDYADIEIFEDVLVVASNTVLKYKVANGSGTGAWTLIRTFSGGGSQNHPICSYNKRLYWLDVGSPDRIYSCDNSYAVSTSSTYTMSLPKEYKVLWMRAYSNGIYIGTIHKNGGEALVFEWDGVTVNEWRRAYKVYAQGALAGYVENDVIYTMNSNAELLQFNGGGFAIVGQLPLQRDLYYKATNITTNDRFIHPNGLNAINGRISALLNTRLNNVDEVSYAENAHSGIWEYEPSVKSFYHKYALSLYEGTVTDYGQIAVARVGGLANVPDIFNTPRANKGNFLAGGKYYSNATTERYGVWTDDYYDSLEKVGWFATVQIPARNFVEMYNKITTLFTPTTGFNFVVKYRTVREEHEDFSITWTSSNTFTTTQAGLTEGDEITIIQGTGGGRVAHISSVSFSSPNYTVTLDETLTGVTGTAKARKQNWKKIEPSISSTLQKYAERLISKPDTWIEIKVAMLGTGAVTIDEMILDNTKNK